MTSRFKRIASLILTAVMTATFAAGNILAFADTSSTKSTSASASSGRYDTVNYENVTGKIDLSSVALKNLSSDVLENTTTLSSIENTTQTLLVTLKQDSIIDSMSSSNTTAAKYLSTFSGERALDKIVTSQENFMLALNKAGISYTLVDTYSTITNTVAIKVNTKYISKITAMSDVESVVLSSTYARPEAVETTSTGAVTNGNNVYATGIYDSSKYLDKADGSGMTVAILDTGLDYTHDAFNVMPEESTLGLTYSQVEELVETSRTLADCENETTKNSTGAVSHTTGVLHAEKLSESAGNTISASDLYLNAKVPFAYDYADKDTDVYPSYSQHGTHVAGIVAGEADSYTDKNGNLAVDSNGKAISFRGVAPKAQLVICKVFTDDLDSSDLGGATTEDILAALDDCVLLNVDIINMSLGTSSGFSSISIDGDTEGQWMNEVYTRIKDQGINLICAASNEFSSGYGSAFGTNLASNPDSGTVGSPSTFVGAMSVASINGQLSRYMTVTDKSGETQSLYYLDSSDANSVQYDFNEQMLGKVTAVNGVRSKTYKYVVIPGLGQASDYTTAIKNALNDKEEGEVVIAVIKRGTTTFQDKIDIAQRMGADAVIVYNNVSGTIRMSLGDLDDPIPSVSVSMDAGKILTSAATNRIGYITLSDDYQAGPFMNDYSSWGTTPDLKLKPDITAHGGEITSTVSGGYDEMSGTSMASPNLAGFVALLRSYLKNNWQNYFSSEPSAKQLTQLTNQIVMSTAETVLDQEGLPYSPRKQGAGLASLANVFSTNAYLYTIEEEGGAEDDRPKIELGEDKDKKGVYNLTFYVKNFGTSSLTFTAESIFMTETLSSDGLAVAEKAHLLTDIAPVYMVNGVASNGTFTVAAGTSAKIQVTLTLSDAEKKYIDQSFENGMYVEGFIRLNSSDTNVQCDLNLPFMGFYGDWESSPMLDYNAYEIAEFKQDTSYTDETRPQAQVWATQAYATYYNEKYTIPMGSFLYTQDESADQIYTDSEHAAISRYNVYYGEDETTNYMTSTTIKALYAGLLRNAELVTYKLYDTQTGELIKESNVYRVNKAVSNGGSATPAQVLLELDPQELGLVSNGQYTLDFQFYFKASDADNPEKQNEDNAFSMTFYVDYDAPIMEDASIRYYDYKDGNKEKQKVYLDIDVYDNTYAQSVMLCYNASKEDGVYELQMATSYVTPIYNAVKNGTNTVSIEITDLISTYQDGDVLYVQLDDYALNHCVYTISFSNSSHKNLPSSFSIVDDSRYTTDKDGNISMTLGVNETFKIKLDYEGTANASNFYWESSKPRVLQVQNGEIFGSSVGEAVVTVTGSDGANRKITVKVENKGYTLSTPTISFGVIVNSTDNLQKASGTVKVNAGQNFKLEIVADVWYYPVDSLNIEWSSSNEKIATVDQEGNVSTKDEKGTAIISAVVLDENGNKTLYSATVSLSVQEPFTVSSSSLTKYHGTGGNVVIPDDKNITTISSEAFKDNDNIVSIVIPKTVTTISERAFINCTALKYVYFISTEKIEPADASINLIYKNAFSGCTSLEVVDFTNAKELTLDNYVFTGCTSLKEIKNMSCIGTMGRNTFAGCTSLKSADLTGLHTAGVGVFAGCTSLSEVTTDYYTAIGTSMFAGCTSLKEVTIKTPTIGNSAFAGCTSLEKVTFADGTNHSVDAFTIGDDAFNGCTALATVDFNGKNVAKIGDMAFANCTALKNITLPTTDIYLGNRVFENTQVELGNEKDEHGAIYNGTKLLLAPTTITSSFAIKAGTTEIAAYAFSNSTLATGVKTIVIPDTVTVIGEGAFAYLNLSNITLPANLTKIDNFTFYHASDLTTITIPAAVKEIGNSVFDTCSNLGTVVFEDGSNLKKMGNGVFYSCTALQEIVLPDGITEMGDHTFTGCTELVKVTLPSVEKLGARTFWQCIKLEEVTFGANATATGEYTFASTYEDVESGNVLYWTTVLTKVTLSDKIKSIGEGVFNYCTSLTSIDLKKVTKVGDYAFSGCSALANVTGLDKLTDIGDYAFAGCTSLQELNLESAKNIGQYAFFIDRNEDGNSNITAYISLSAPKVESIGNFAFAGSSLAQVSLPATLKTVGYGAFISSPRLTSFEVDKDNKVFFTDSNGILYRNITDVTTGKTVYELVAYPTAKNGASYTILEGTVSVAHYAFAYLMSSSLQEVTIPYSVKVLGVGAFYSSGITSYVFEAINAPTLLSEYYENGTASFYSLYYINFEDNFITHTEWSDQEDSTIKITYPSNGSGYTNYVYTYYFGSSEITAELINDTTRELKALIESFDSAETVATWSSLTVNTENTKKVSDFADSVKEAHRILNTITSDTQRGFLGEENITKLTAIENALKDVKSHFGISAAVSSLRVSSDSTHKSTYKEGEMFDMTGLKIIVTYDDYSSEEADLSQLKLNSRFDGVELTTLNRYVIIEGYGKSVQVAITVTEDGDASDDGEQGGDDGNGEGGSVEAGGGCAGCGSIDSGSGWIIGGLAVLAIAYFAVRLVKKSKADDKGV